MEQWIIPTAWAYSSKCNNRRLEHHFHGIWNLVFQDLIADLGPYIFVVPQYQIDSAYNGPIAPDDSIATAAQPNATECTPDFSIVKTYAILRPEVTINIEHLPYISWNSVAVKAFIVPLIGELKHPPTRRSPSLASFVENLKSMFDEAYRSLEKQVENAFAMQSTNVNRMILCACVGEWWSWKIATRDHYTTDDSDKDFQNTSSDILPPSLFIQTVGRIVNDRPARAAKNEKARAKCIDPPNPPAVQSSDKLPYHPHRRGEEHMRKRSEYPIHYEDLGEYMEQVAADVELAKPLDNDWSKYIRLGTPASNQRLFLIHRFLGTECTTMLDTSVNDDDEEEEEEEEEDDNDNDNDDEGDDDDDDDE